MDLYAIIRELEAEKQRLDRIIQALEELEKSAFPIDRKLPARRVGRKWMSAEERREVSERMRKYWANRRAQ